MLELYKEPGLTPLEFINNIKKQYPEQKICYTARLDPMARGLVPILFGDECKTMHNYTNLSKTYEVKVMIGYKTDSDDVLGILETQGLHDLYKNHLDIISNYKYIFDIENEITNTIIKQKYHYFSTKELLARSKGKTNSNNQYHDVKLFSSKIIDSGILDLKKWVNTCIQIIDKVDKTKDFRQKEIIEQWQKILIQEKEKENKILTIQYITLKLHVGSGFFVRQYIRDISNKIGIPLMCYDIHRTKIDY